MIETDTVAGCTSFDLFHDFIYWRSLFYKALFVTAALHVAPLTTHSFKNIKRI